MQCNSLWIKANTVMLMSSFRSLMKTWEMRREKFRKWNEIKCYKKLNWN